MRSGSLLKIQFIYSFLMLGSEGRRFKDCVFPQLGTAQHLLVFRAIFIVWFIRRPAFVSLVISTCVNQWAGLSRQWCRSRRWSGIEAGGGTPLRHKVTHSTRCRFGRLASIYTDFRITSFEFWNLQDVFIVQWPLICQKIRGILISHVMTPLNLYFCVVVHKKKNIITLFMHVCFQNRTSLTMKLELLHQEALPQRMRKPLHLMANGYSYWIQQIFRFYI